MGNLQESAFKNETFLVYFKIFACRNVVSVSVKILTKLNFVFFFHVRVSHDLMFQWKQLFGKNVFSSFYISGVFILILSLFAFSAL